MNAERQHFFEWLEQRYPGWPLPRLFVELLLISPCRE